jgi:asparagine synthase (glutamine-hydrolysing)
MSADFVRFVRHHKRLPLASTIWRLGARSADEPDTPQLPRWIAPSLVDRLQLRERWQRVMRGPRPSPHPTKPMAYWSLLNPMWHVVFDADDPAYTGVPIDVRHPYLDLRLLRFLLRVPAIPWARDKHLFRYALSDHLPATIRKRPKTPLKGEPDYERGRRFGLPPVRASEELERYGSPVRLLKTGFRTAAEAEADLRFIALSYWLEQLRTDARLRVAATLMRQ